MLITEFCLTVLAIVAPAIVFLLSAIYDTLRKIREEMQILSIPRSVAAKNVPVAEAAIQALSQASPAQPIQAAETGPLFAQ